MMMQTTRFRRRLITAEMIREAMGRFDHDDDYSDIRSAWRNRKSYKYAVKHMGQLYPPKLLLSNATGVPRKSFNGGEETNRVFRQLGFDVIDKPD